MLRPWANSLSLPNLLLSLDFVFTVQSQMLCLIFFQNIFSKSVVGKLWLLTVLKHSHENVLTSDLWLLLYYSGRYQDLGKTHDPECRHFHDLEFFSKLADLFSMTSDNSQVLGLLKPLTTSTFSRSLHFSQQRNVPFFHQPSLWSKNSARVELTQCSLAASSHHSVPCISGLV